jgi:hypothetical protein
MSHDATLIILGIIFFIAFIAVAYFLLRAFAAAVAISGFGAFAFFSTKDPLRWIGLCIWGLGMWLAWEYLTSATELVCPKPLDRCYGWQMIEVRKFVGESLVFSMALLSALITVSAAIVVMALHDKLASFGYGNGRMSETTSISVAEAAKRFGLSQGAIRKKLRDGTLPGFKGDDGRWYVRWYPD